MYLDNLKINQRRYYNNLPNSAFWGWLSTESQPQNPEFRINPENVHPWVYVHYRPASERTFKWVDSGPLLDVCWHWFDLPMQIKFTCKLTPNTCSWYMYSDSPDYHNRTDQRSYKAVYSLLRPFLYFTTKQFAQKFKIYTASPILSIWTHKKRNFIIDLSIQAHCHNII